MKIEADEEGKKAIVELCDAVLKAGLIGVQGLAGITKLLNCLEKPKEEKESIEEQP